MFRIGNDVMWSCTLMFRIGNDVMWGCTLMFRKVMLCGTTLSCLE